MQDINLVIVKVISVSYMSQDQFPWHHLSMIQTQILGSFTTKTNM